MKQGPPPDPLQPVRKIGRSRRAITGTLSSPKSGGGAEYESALERDHYLGLEFDPLVAWIVPQPVTIHYRDETGRRRRYTPDTLVEYVDARPPGLFEVKYVQEVSEKAALFAVVFRAARQYAREEGWTFTLVTERTVRTVLLKNAQFLRPFLRRTFPDALEAELLYALARLKDATPERLLGCFPAERRLVLLPVLWKLIASRRIGTDLGVAVTMTSPLLPGEDP